MIIPFNKLENKLGNKTLNINLKTHIIFPIIISIITFFSYYNSLFNNFTYDDKFILTQNYEFQNIHKINSLFNNSYFAYSQELSYRPLVTISHLIDYTIWGLKPFGHHLTNLFLHIIVTLLFYELVKQLIITPPLLSRKFTPENDSGLQSASPLNNTIGDTYIRPLQFIPFFSALLFGVLTIHTETVCSIGLRADVLMAIFFFLFIIFIIIYFQKKYFVLKIVQDIHPELSNNKVINNSKIKQQKSPRIYYSFIILSALMYFCALLSKETALTFLIFLILYHLLILKIKLKRYISIYLPHLFITIFYLIIRFILIKNPMESELVDYGTQIKLIFLIPYIFVKYILTTLLPIDLSVNYFIDFQDKLLTYRILLSYIIIILLLMISILLIKKEKIISFCILSFFCLLIPVANLLPIANPLAERYLYLPSISFCLFISYILIRCRDAKYCVSTFDKYKKVGILALILITIFNFILTINRNKVWKNDFTLWTSEIRKMDTIYLTPTGDSLWDRIIARPYANLGIYYLENKKFDLASDYLEKAHNFNKNSLRIISSLAISQYKSGHKTEAINILTNLNLDKLSPSNKVIIGDAFYDINDFENALKIYTQITSHDEDPKYKIKLAKTLISMGQAKTSIDKSLIQRGKEICANIVQSDKYNFEAMIPLTISLYHLGDYKNAKEIGLNALKINNNIPYLYFILASIEEKVNDLEEAEKNYKQVIKLNPLEVDAYINLGTLYAHQGKNDKAKEWWEKGLWIEKDNKIIQDNLKRLSEKQNLR